MWEDNVESVWNEKKRFPRHFSQDSVGSQKSGEETVQRRREQLITLNVAEMSATIRTEKCHFYLAIKLINDLHKSHSDEEIRRIQSGKMLENQWKKQK